MNTELIKPKLIEELVQQRADFIELNLQSMLLQKKVIELGLEIDHSIPTQNRGYIDSFDSVIHDISARLGENTKNRTTPKHATVLSYSESKLRETITKTVDGTLWLVLFNRLGLMSAMSREQIAEFRKDCKSNPQPFTLEIVQETLASMYENRYEVLINALFDCFNGLSGTYVSNDRKMFSKKVVIENSFIEYGDNFKLCTHEELETLLAVVWRWVLVNDFHFDKDGLNRNAIFEELSQVMASSSQDYSKVATVHSHGIQFRFFKKKTVHVIFPDYMIQALNDQLAKSKALPNDR